MTHRARHHPTRPPGNRGSRRHHNLRSGICDIIPEWCSSNANNWTFAVCLPGGEVAMVYMDDSETGDCFEVGRPTFGGIFADLFDAGFDW